MNPTQEQWRPVVGYEGYYEVSDLGRVRSIDRVVQSVDGRSMRYSGVVLAGKASKSGRVQVALARPGHRTWTPLVHRLVLDAFVGPCPDGHECCHYDDNPQNNRLENLRWDTKVANARDAARNRRNANANKTHCPVGHPYDDENTLWHRGGRDCRECGRNSRNRRYREMRAVAQATGGWEPNLGGFCEYGHEYTADNTYTYPDGKKRACLICKRRASREAARRYRAKYPERHREAQRKWAAKQRQADRSN